MGAGWPLIMYGIYFPPFTSSSFTTVFPAAAALASDSAFVFWSAEGTVPFRWIVPPEVSTLMVFQSIFFLLVINAFLTLAVVTASSPFCTMAPVVEVGPGAAAEGPRGDGRAPGPDGATGPASGSSF